MPGYGKGVPRSNAPPPAFRAHLQGFVRQFGLLVEDQTPCGQPLPLSHAHALLVLRESGETPLRQKELAVALGLNKSSIARLCARLQQRGCVFQTPSPTDARARDVLLTAKGRKRADEVEQSSRARFERLWCAVPGSERAGVLQALAVLQEAAVSLEKEKENSP